MSDRLATPLFGLDYTNEIPVSVLKGVGAKFVYRYTSRSSWKVLTKGERDRIHAAGIGLCIVFEDGADNALNGYAQGQQDAQWSRNWYQDYGFPVTRPVSWAVDDDVDPARCDQYADGFSSIWPRNLNGPYGSARVVGHFADRGHACQFQTYAWSGGAVDGRARVLQYSNEHFVDFSARFGGYNVDFDHAFYADYGQVWIAPPAPSDPYGLKKFPTKVVWRDGHVTNERLVVEKVLGALEHPGKFKNYLKGDLRAQVKVHRDRCKAVATSYKPARWSDDRKLGERWQQLNGYLKKIDKLR